MLLTLKSYLAKKWGGYSPPQPPCSAVPVLERDEFSESLKILEELFVVPYLYVFHDSYAHILLKLRYFYETLARMQE